MPGLELAVIVQGSRIRPACESALLCLLVFGLPALLAAAEVDGGEILVESPTLEAGEMVPRDYTPDGRNLSPPLTWTQLPEGTKEIAVVCADFGAGNPPPWVHWVIYGIPGSVQELPAGLPILPDEPMPPELAGAKQGLNGWRLPLYRGPAPPAGKPHLYHFTVYALDQELNLGEALTRDDLLEAMSGHIIGQGDLVPIYERF